MFDPQIVIDGRVINADSQPYIIAELSGNHGQCLDRARAMIATAARAGVDAVKLQTYTADTLTLDSHSADFVIAESDNLWQGNTLHSLYAKAATPWEWHSELFAYARELGVTLFSSPFDESSVDFLQQFDPPAYKIASFELNHTPLLRAVAQTGKPVIMSTGMAKWSDIEQAVAALHDNGCRQLALMICTSAYPAPEEDANLKTMDDLRRRLQLPVGLSDHSLGLDVARIALARGAQLIERHLVLERNSDAVDAVFSSTPEDFAELVNYAGRVKAILGQVHYGAAPSEENSLRYRRSIYCAKPIAAGEIFTVENLKVVRPAHGLDPAHWDDLLGRRSAQAVAVGTAIQWDMVAEVDNKNGGAA